MVIFIVRRILQAIPVVFLASVGVFLLLHLLPRRICRDTAWIDALDLSMSINSWLRLRGDQNLSPAQAQRAVLMVVKALIAVKAD